MPTRIQSVDRFLKSWQFNREKKKEQARVNVLLQKPLIAATLQQLKAEHGIDIPFRSQSVFGTATITECKDQEFLVLHIGFDEGRKIIQRYRPKRITCGIVSQNHGLWLGDAVFILDDRVPLEIRIGDSIFVPHGIHHVVLAHDPVIPSLISRDIYDIKHSKPDKDSGNFRTPPDPHGKIVQFKLKPTS